MPSIEVGPTTLTYDLDFRFRASYVMAYSRANVQGQRSVGSENRMETNGRTDGGDCITCRINAVGI